MNEKETIIAILLGVFITTLGGFSILLFRMGDLTAGVFLLAPTGILILLAIVLALIKRRNTLLT